MESFFKVCFGRILYTCSYEDGMFHVTVILTHPLFWTYVICRGDRRTPTG
jgi:hypothetical protein